MGGAQIQQHGASMPGTYSRVTLWRSKTVPTGGGRGGEALTNNELTHNHHISKAGRISEMFHQNCLTKFTPRCYLSMDEQRVMMGHKTGSYRSLAKNKPIKTGVTIIAGCEEKPDIFARSWSTSASLTNAKEIVLHHSAIVLLLIHNHVDHGSESGKCLHTLQRSRSCVQTCIPTAFICSRGCLQIRFPGLDS